MDFSDCEEAIELYPSSTLDMIGPTLPPLQIKTPRREVVSGLTKDTPLHFMEFTNHKKYCDDLRQLYLGEKTADSLMESCEPFKPGYPFNYSLCSPACAAFDSYPHLSGLKDTAVINMETLHPFEDSADDAHSYNPDLALSESPKTDYFSDFGPWMPKEVSEISILSGLCSSGSDQDRTVYKDAIAQALRTTKLQLYSNCSDDESLITSNAETMSMQSVSLNENNEVRAKSIPAVKVDPIALKQSVVNEQKTNALLLNNARAVNIETEREDNDIHVRNGAKKRSAEHTKSTSTGHTTGNNALETQISTSVSEKLKDPVGAPKTRKRGPRKRRTSKKKSMLVTLVYDRSKTSGKKRRRRK